MVCWVAEITERRSSFAGFANASEAVVERNGCAGEPGVRQSYGEFSVAQLENLCAIPDDLVFFASPV